jgi:hypothetical protein
MKLAAQRVTWKLKPSAGGGYEGEVVIPLPVAPVTVTTRGRSKKQALARAAAAANSIASNPLLAAVLPPGTPTAVKAITALATDPSSITRFAGPGAKRLAKALGKIF